MTSDDRPLQLHLASPSRWGRQAPSMHASQSLRKRPHHLVYPPRRRIRPHVLPTVEPLIWVEAAVESHRAPSVEYVVKCKAQFKRRSTANSVEMWVPVPGDADSPKFRVRQASCQQLETDPDRHRRVTYTTRPTSPHSCGR